MTTLDDIAQRFANEAGQHEMEVVHDAGLYRHIRFRHQGPAYSGYYWFDLITVPGTLIFQGDGESFVFSRVEDMFEFFRSPVGQINPHYWAEKVTSDRARLRRYDEDLFRQAVDEHVTGYYEPNPVPEALRRVIDEEILDDGYLGIEDAALRLAAEFAYYEDPDDRWKAGARPDFQFTDPWEWHIRDYDWWFLWALHAIVWGIAKYDAHHADALGNTA